MYSYNLYEVKFANDSNKSTILTEDQFKTGLDLDTYMSLIDPDWSIG